MDDTAAKLHFASLLGMPAQLMYPFMFPPTACTFYRTPTSSPASSPPGSPGLPGCEGSPPTSKSFTIDAILGLRPPPPERAMEPQQCARLTTDVRPDTHKEKLGGPGRRVGRPKRVRTIFTTEQLDIMEKAFTMQQYMVGKQRCHLAKTLNLHENQVKVWFQNRRIKWRRQNLEREQARLAQLSQPSSPRPSSGSELPQPDGPVSPASAADQHTRLTQNIQNTQNMQNTQNTHNSQNTQLTHNTQLTQHTQNTQNTHNSQNTQSTQSTQSTQLTQHTQLSQRRQLTQYTELEQLPKLSPPAVAET